MNFTSENVASADTEMKCLTKSCHDIRILWLARTVLLSCSCLVLVSMASSQVVERPLGQYRGQVGSLHLQRFLLPAGTVVDSVTLGLSGPVSEHAGNIEIHGHSEGRIVPLSSTKPLVAVPVAKTTVGYQRVTLPISYTHAGGQVFVGFRQIEDDVTLVTDRHSRKAVCFDDGVPWNDQVRVEANGSRKVLPFGFDIELVSKSNSNQSRVSFARDTLVEEYDLRPDGSSVSNIVVADVTNDGVPDVLCFGVVQQWSGSDWKACVVDPTSRASYGAVADLDGEGKASVVLISEASSHRSAILYTFNGDKAATHEESNRSNGHFLQRATCSLPSDEPVVAHVILDLNGDGSEEILLIQSRTYSLLRKSQRGIEVVRIPTLGITDDAVAATLVPNEFGQASKVVVRLSRGSIVTFLASELLAGPASPSIRSINDTSAYRTIAFQTHYPDTFDNWSTTVLAPARADDSKPHFSPGSRAEETLSSSLVADLDLDGRPEIVNMSLGQCRFLSAWSNPKGALADETYAMGLHGIDDVRDGVVADIDGNLTPDLILIRRGRLEVYKGSGSHAQSPYVFVRNDKPTQQLPELVEQRNEYGSSVWLRHNVHGGGMQVSNIAPLQTRRQLGPSELIVTWDRGSQSRERFTSDDGSVIRRGAGNTVISSSDTSAVTYADGIVTLVGQPVGSLVSLQLHRSDGSTLRTWPQITVSGRRHEIDIADVLSTCSSGVYFVSAVVRGERYVANFTHIR